MVRNILRLRYFATMLLVAGLVYGSWTLFRLASPDPELVEARTTTLLRGSVKCENPDIYAWDEDQEWKSYSRGVPVDEYDLILDNIPPSTEEIYVTAVCPGQSEVGPAWFIEPLYGNVIIIHFSEGGEAPFAFASPGR